MYYVKKIIEISSSHKLDLPYESKCKNLHGHNWKITVYLKSEKLTEYGMVMDFVHIKNLISELDHKNLNETLDFNPTAENIARFLSDQLTINNVICYKVEVQESENNIAIYERD